MANIIQITREPVRVTATGYQPLWEAVDVLGYDVIDLLFGLVGLTGTTPAVSVQVVTGMQTQSDNGWVLHTQIGSGMNSAPTYVKVRIDQPLRYLRWNVDQLTGTSPTATFFLEGMGRWTA